MSSRGWRPARAAAALAAAVLLAGCGKKGDPMPPLLPVPQAAADLAVQQRGSELILRFAYPRTTAAGLPLPPLERVEVYELVRPAITPPPPPPPETGSAEAEIATIDFESGGPPPSPDAPDAPAPAPDPAAAAPETPGAADPPAEPAAAAPTRYLAPPVDEREFTAAATAVRTLRGEEMSGAVHGDQLVVTLPLPSPLPEPPQAHLFAVRTVAEGDFASAFSNRAAIVPEPPPPAPHALAATAGPEGVEIAWEAGGDGRNPQAGFHVYRRLATERGFGPPLRLVGAAQRSHLDRSARYGQRYVYAVTAVARRTPLIESAIAAAREVDYRDVFAPPVPQGLVALADAGAVRLVWDAARAPDLAGYRVHRRRGDGPWETLTAEPIEVAEYTDRAVAAGDAYHYRVTAVDELGNESEPSAETRTVAR